MYVYALLYPDPEYASRERDHGRGYAANRDREIPTVTSGAQVKGSLKEGKECGQVRVR